jgi:DNA excision repair protein ERCC-4
MQKIQNALLECIEVCLSELKRSNPTLDLEEWTPDAALHRNFDVTVRRILDPIWHRVSWKTRGIVADLSLLRRILQYSLPSLS